jgi:hypothetical protein
VITGGAITTFAAGTTRAARRTTAISFAITKTIKNPSNILTATFLAGKIIFLHLANGCPYIENRGTILAFIGIIRHSDIFLFLSVSEFLLLNHGLLSE